MQIITVIRLVCSIWLLLFTFNDYTRGGHHGGGHHGGHRGGHGRHAGGHGGRHRAWNRGGGGYGHHYGGYGRGYGYYGGYGRWAGGWGWNNPWVGLPWWGLNWQPGYIGNTQYEYVIPDQARQAVYKDYPYWGYDLGADNELDQLAQQGNWGQVGKRLSTLHDQYQQELNNEFEKNPEERNGKRINELKDKIYKVQLHMRGLRSQK
jgi:hypothetical protein